MDGTATISLDTLDELREKAEEARLATNRSKRFTSKLMDCYEFDTEKYNKALEEIDEKENLTDKQCSKLIREAMVKHLKIVVDPEQLKELIQEYIDEETEEDEMVKKLYEVRNRSGDLILENVTSGEIREELHCTTAQVNNARTSGDHIFGEYKVEEIDRKLSRKTDFDLLREFESVCDQLLGSRKGKK